jgi:pimeloyl-ACP methyl ester carboxylesterase
MSFPVARGSLEGYEQDDLGYRERFSTPTIGGGTTVAVHSEPLDPTAPVSWVVLHSFGPEQDNLAAFDALLCRALAAAGHATVRYHAQGHGDSELGPEALGVEDQVAGALEAVELARRETTSGVVGLIGVRFGGAIAALAAARADVGALVLVDPITKGRAFLRSLVRMDLATEVTLGSKAPVRKGDPFEVAKSEGVLDIEGFAVPWPAVVEFEALDLLKATIPSAIPALVVQISRSDAPRDDLRRLVERLGSRASLEVVVDDDAFRFGLPSWRLAGPDGPSQKVDSLAGLAGAVVRRTVHWCVQEGGSRG